MCVYAEIARWANVSGVGELFSLFLFVAFPSDDGRWKENLIVFFPMSQFWNRPTLREVQLALCVVACLYRLTTNKESFFFYLFL